MPNQSTVESKATTQNGVKRLIFCALAILLQLLFWILLFMRLSRYTQVIEYATWIFGLILVLVIYSQNKTASLKMPWIVLILVTPVLGVILYLLIGLDYSVWTVTKRYQQIDSVLLPKLPENKEILDKMRQENPKAHCKMNLQ